jgi:hypothetical protein
MPPDGIKSGDKLTVLPETQRSRRMPQCLRGAGTYSGGASLNTVRPTLMDLMILLETIAPLTHSHQPPRRHKRL